MEPFLFLQWYLIYYYIFKKLNRISSWILDIIHVRRFVPEDVLSIYILSHYTFCPYTLYHIIPFVRICCVALYLLSVYVLSHCIFCPDTFCRFIPYVIFDVLSVYVLSLYTLWRYTFCCCTFSPLDVLSLYILSLYVLSLDVASKNQTITWDDMVP
jgi:hypothetical protein